MVGSIRWIVAPWVAVLGSGREKKSESNRQRTSFANAKKRRKTFQAEVPMPLKSRLVAHQRERCSPIDRSCIYLKGEEWKLQLDRSSEV